MVSVLTLSEIDRGSSPYRVKFIFVGSPLSMQHSLAKIRVGRLTVNTHIFFFGLSWIFIVLTH
jgi:hypothetical protein